jgi:hypothetical protein
MLSNGYIICQFDILDIILLKPLNLAFMSVGRMFTLLGICIGLIRFIQFEVSLAILVKFSLNLWQRWQSSSFALIRFINKISVLFVLPLDLNSVKMELYTVDTSNRVRI